MVVYPRWRGEHGCWRWHIWQLAGLSPLARGTRERIHAPLRRLRFIPAGAGNTFPGPALMERVPVYPRWSGEHGIFSGRAG